MGQRGGGGGGPNDTVSHLNVWVTKADAQGAAKMWKGEGGRASAATLADGAVRCVVVGGPRSALSPEQKRGPIGVPAPLPLPFSFAVADA